MPGGDFNYTQTSKRSPFEDGLRTPILIRWDRQTRPAIHESPCSSVDILPTLLDALELEDEAAGLPGRSLWSSATGREPLASRPVFGEIYPGDASSIGHPSRDIAYRWIRDGRFKLIVPHVETGRQPWGHYLDDVALFDVVADPQERHDLAGNEEHAKSVSRLKRQLDQWWTP